MQGTLASGGSSLALAFLCTKATLPVRVPLTVAITPAIARCRPHHVPVHTSVPASNGSHVHVHASHRRAHCGTVFMLEHSRACRVSLIVSNSAQSCMDMPRLLSHIRARDTGQSSCCLLTLCVTDCAGFFATKLQKSRGSYRA